MTLKEHIDDIREGLEKEIFIMAADVTDTYFLTSLTPSSEDMSNAKNQNTWTSETFSHRLRYP